MKKLLTITALEKSQAILTCNYEVKCHNLRAKFTIV